MSQLFAIHPDNPQARLLRQAATIIEEGGLIVYPTDSGYALGCLLGNKSALERIRRLRQLGKDHNMTLVCRDLSHCTRLMEGFDDQNPFIRALRYEEETTSKNVEGGETRMG